jgi:GH24 family phage-related lysozyme (muramidase)
MRIDEAQAENLLARDIMLCEQCVNTHVSQKINQLMFDALVSFVFNFGCERFKTSTLLRYLNEGEYVKAAEQFGRWVNSRNPKTGKLEPLPGLVARRAKERQMFERGMLELMGNPKPASETPEENPRYPLKSATNAGLAVSAVGVVGTEAAQLASEVAPLVVYSDVVKTVFVVLTLVGIGIAAWGRFRVYKERGV